MDELGEGRVIKEFEDFDISLEHSSPLLEKLIEIGHTYKLSAEELCNEWVAFSTRNGDIKMEADRLDQWEGDLHISSRKAPSGKRNRSKSKVLASPTTAKNGVYSQENLQDLFGDEVGGGVQDNSDVYGLPQEQGRQNGRKRVNETTPTTPLPSSKMRHNGSTPVTPHNGTNGSTPYRIMAENSMLSSTPAATYHQRENAGQVMCSLNDSLLSEKWVGSSAELDVQHYNPDTALSATYKFMFQKVSDKSQVLMERVKEFGGAICEQHGLSPPVCVSQPSLEPAVFTGMVTCEGEGHLNAQSCLLEGLSHARHQKGACVKMEIPHNLSCSLFPGQIVAVEGVNNYNGLLTPTRIYDEGVTPPPPKRTDSSVPGFTMMCAAGPFSTTDSLSLDPLHSLLEVVKQETPNVLVLGPITLEAEKVTGEHFIATFSLQLGPFLDSSHPLIKSGDVPGDQTYEEFFKKNVITPIFHCTKGSKTRTIVVPSQRDVHHPLTVYPQPPFQLPPTGKGAGPDWLFRAPDPATLSVSGLCVGMTSTDVLFHLSARSMSRGPVGDRMSRVAKHIIQQQCYYPLFPAFCREEPSSTPKTPSATPTATPTSGSNGVQQATLSEERSEMNLDLIHMFDDYEYACLPVRPDLLLLPSNLKPFAKVIDGCVCVNPGHLTKRTGGGTFAKITISNQLRIRQDLSSDIGAQIVYI